jgi:hypothetical protein
VHVALFSVLLTSCGQVATVPPLCLEPDLQLTRVANNVIRATNAGPPTSLKRKASAIDPEEDDVEKARRARIMQIWNPRAHRPTRTAPTKLATLHSPKSFVSDFFQLFYSGRHRKDKKQANSTPD